MARREGCPRSALLTQRRAWRPSDLDTLATALYVTTDDLLKESPQLSPYRPEVGIDPKMSDAELVTLAVMQALLGFTSEAGRCDTPRLTYGTCSPACHSSPVTTSGCVPRGLADRAEHHPLDAVAAIPRSPAPSAALPAGCAPCARVLP